MKLENGGMKILRAFQDIIGISNFTEWIKN